MGLAVVAAACCALYFIIQLNLNFAILSMLILFTLTNASRAINFKDQGLYRESRWMKWLSVFFGIAAVVVLAIILL